MMSTHPFSGTGVAIVTPFLDNGDIDEKALEQLIDHLIDGKVDYLVALGTTGETATLSYEEKATILSLVNKYNKGRIRLVAGIGGNDTRSVVKSLKSFDLSGYSAILSVGPYYNKPNNEGIFQHYKAINDAAPLPVIMYNVPGRTGCNINTQTTLRIAKECKNIIATKEASGNMEQIMQIIKEKPQGFEVISGDDALTLPLIACGAIGVISVIANAYPTHFSQMVKLCLDGKFEAARPIHEKLIPAIQSIFSEGSPSGVKTYLTEMGIVKYNFRLPVVGVSDVLKQEIRGIMKTL
jgi:4-hydroxy-tetrahydrodipicolinate synthase